MKNKYLLTLLMVLGMMNLVLAQSSQNIDLQSKAKDTSQVIPLSGQQVNVVLPASGGTYINSTTTVLPFTGYSISGVAKAYFMYNGNTNQIEYHQSSDATPDFYINGNTKAVFNTSFVGIGTATPTTGYTGFSMKSSANGWYGMYIDAGATGAPFYGYALNGTAVAYTQYNGTTNQLEYYHSNPGVPDFQMSSTNVAYPATTFMGIGTTTPTTAYTGLTLKSIANTWFGTYVDAGATGLPFYGYALNGVARAYTSFNSASSQFEYHQTSDGTPDFYINGNTKAVFNTAFLGIGTGTATTGYTGFTMKSAANSWYGMYIDAGATGAPFYGYALNGTAVAYTQYNGTTNQLEYYHSNPGVPDFQMSSTNVAYPATTFLGIGTTTPTTAYTGLALKNNTNNFWGMYVDAGATGSPFYGYALNGVARAYTKFNSASGQFEYHQTSDGTPDFLINGTTKAVFNTAFFGIGTEIRHNWQLYGFYNEEQCEYLVRDVH